MGTDVRQVLPSATVFLLETRPDLTDASADVLRETLADVEHFNALAAEVIASAWGRTVGEVAEWRGVSARFSAHQAVAAGLARDCLTDADRFRVDELLLAAGQCLVGL